MSEETIDSEDYQNTKENASKSFRRLQVTMPSTYGDGFDRILIDMDDPDTNSEEPEVVTHKIVITPFVHNYDPKKFSANPKFDYNPPHEISSIIKHNCVKECSQLKIETTSLKGFADASNPISNSHKSAADGIAEIITIDENLKADVKVLQSLSQPTCNELPGTKKPQHENFQGAKSEANKHGYSDNNNEVNDCLSSDFRSDKYSFQGREKKDSNDLEESNNDLCKLNWEGQNLPKSNCFKFVYRHIKSPFSKSKICEKFLVWLCS